MVSPESTEGESPSSPRISFSADFLDEKNFISITPNTCQNEKEDQVGREKAKIADFEFLSNNVSTNQMLSADELFFEGKLLPFWKMQQAEKFNKISLKAKDNADEGEDEVEVNKEENRVSWFVDDDPSPRPPKCTVLWKELLKLRKQRASSLSPSSSSSSSSSSASSLADIAAMEDKKNGSENGQKHVRRTRKGLERTRSNSIKIRPMINVPICTQVKSNSLPPLFSHSHRKGRLDR